MNTIIKYLIMVILYIPACIASFLSGFAEGFNRNRHDPITHVLLISTPETHAQMHDKRMTFARRVAEDFGEHVTVRLVALSERDGDYYTGTVDIEGQVHDMYVPAGHAVVSSVYASGDIESYLYEDTEQCARS